MTTIFAKTVTFTDDPFGNPDPFAPGGTGGFQPPELPELPGLPIPEADPFQPVAGATCPAGTRCVGASAAGLCFGVCVPFDEDESLPNIPSGDGPGGPVPTAEEIACFQSGGFWFNAFGSEFCIGGEGFAPGGTPSAPTPGGNGNGACGCKPKCPCGTRTAKSTYTKKIDRCKPLVPGNIRVVQKGSCIPGKSRRRFNNANGKAQMRAISRLGAAEGQAKKLLKAIGYRKISKTGA